MLSHQEQRRRLTAPTVNPNGKRFGRPKVTPRPAPVEPVLKSTDHLMVVDVKAIGFSPKDEHGNVKLTPEGDELFIKLGIGVYMADGSRYLKAYTKVKLSVGLSFKVINVAGGWSVKRPGDAKSTSIANSDHHLRRVMSERLTTTLIRAVKDYIALKD